MRRVQCGQFQNFSRALRGEEALFITADDALTSVEVIETAYQALRQENWGRIAARRGDSVNITRADGQVSMQLNRRIMIPSPDRW